MKKYNLSIFIFRRDLRLADNIGLIEALKLSNKVVPIFIFTPEQLVRNPYKSNNCVQFMMESLDDLDNDLRNKKSRLFYFYGKPKDVVKKIIQKIKPDALFLNMDYTPYSAKRDNEIKIVCQSYDIDFLSFEDVLLNNVGSILTLDGSVYSKFTPYFNKANKITVRKSIKNNYSNYYSGKTRIVGEFRGNKKQFYKYNSNLVVNGGRKLALKRLNRVDKFKKYNIQRNILSIETTRLSAYIKFGCISIREVYEKFRSKLGMKNDLIKQLYWRDFYYNLMYYYPDMITGKNRNFKKKYGKVPWIRKINASEKQKKYFKAWCDGKTGFPIVDAAMRELNETGFMHNRGRLIVASFLTKLLMWHWEEGEKYFSNKLIDIDVSVNLGNWEWSAGSGADSQPYFRIFNPWSQSQKYDPDAKYIKKWIPELKNVDPNHIHNWDEYCDDEEYENIKYPKPIIDYEKARENAIKKFKKAFI